MQRADRGGPHNGTIDKMLGAKSNDCGFKEGKIVVGDLLADLLSRLKI